MMLQLQNAVALSLGRDTCPRSKISTNSKKIIKSLTKEDSDSSSAESPWSERSSPVHPSNEQGRQSVSLALAESSELSAVAAVVENEERHVQ